MEIRKVKTFHGLKWAVTQPFTKINAKGKKITEHFPIEYKGVNFEKNKNDIRVAVFPLTQDGFNKAKELQKKLK